MKCMPCDNECEIKLSFSNERAYRKIATINKDPFFFAEIKYYTRNEESKYFCENGNIVSKMLNDLQYL